MLIVWFKRHCGSVQKYDYNKYACRAEKCYSVNCHNSHVALFVIFY